jgi:hypothetical protein
MIAEIAGDTKTPHHATLAESLARLRKFVALQLSTFALVAKTFLY